MADKNPKPFEYLNDFIHRENLLIIELKNKQFIEGKLLSFDMHINLVVVIDEKVKFIRGDVVQSISPKE